MTATSHFTWSKLSFCGYSAESNDAYRYRVSQTGITSWNADTEWRNMVSHCTAVSCIVTYELHANMWLTIFVEAPIIARMLDDYKATLNVKFNFVSL